MSDQSTKRTTEHRPDNDPLAINSMAKLLHVDLDQAAAEDTEALKRARERCANCKAGEECAGWLDASFGVSLPPTFCPNAPYFLLSMADRQGR